MKNKPQITTYHPAQLYLMIRKQMLKIAEAEEHLKKANEATNQFYASLVSDKNASQLFKRARRYKKANIASSIVACLGGLSMAGGTIAMLASQNTNSLITAWVGVALASAGLIGKGIASYKDNKLYKEQDYRILISRLDDLQAEQYNAEKEVASLKKELLEIKSSNIRWIANNGRPILHNEAQNIVLNLIDVLNFATLLDLKHFVGLNEVVEDKQMLEDVIMGKEITIADYITFSADNPKGHFFGKVETDAFKQYK